MRFLCSLYRCKIRILLKSFCEQTNSPAEDIKATVGKLEASQIQDLLNLDTIDEWLGVMFYEPLNSQQSLVLKTLVQHSLDLCRKNYDLNLLKMSFFYCGKFSDVGLATDAWECAKQQDAPGLLMHITQELLVCWAGNETIFQFLLQKCKEHDMLGKVMLAADSDGNTTLHNACLEGGPQAAQQLLQAVSGEQDIMFLMMFQTNKDGLTAYSAALRLEKNEVTAALLDVVPNDVMEKIRRLVHTL